MKKRPAFVFLLLVSGFMFQAGCTTPGEVDSFIGSLKQEDIKTMSLTLITDGKQVIPITYQPLQKRFYGALKNSIEVPYEDVNVRDHDKLYELSVCISNGTCEKIPFVRTAKGEGIILSLSDMQYRRSDYLCYIADSITAKN